MIGQKPRKRDRFLHAFKTERRVQASPQASPQPSPQPSPSQSQITLTEETSPPDDEELGDAERTRKRYVEAAKLLEEAVKGSQWGFFGFPELKGEPEEFNDSEFRMKINFALESRKSAVNDKTAWSKCKHTMERLCKSFSPFAKNFLSVAKDASAVKLASFDFSLRVY